MTDIEKIAAILHTYEDMATKPNRWWNHCAFEIIKELGYHKPEGEIPREKIGKILLIMYGAGLNDASAGRTKPSRVVTEQTNEILKVFKGYQKLPEGEMPLLSDEEIRKAIKEAMDMGQEYGDDGEPLPERCVAKAQRELCIKCLNSGSG